MTEDVRTVSRYVNGTPFDNETYMEWLPFPSKMRMVRGWTSSRSLLV